MTQKVTRAAALPMYDLPELEAAHDALWAAIAVRLRAECVAGVPERLTRTEPLESIWSDPNLLLTQTCGYPLMTSLHERVALVATPHYSAPGCDGPFYRSAVIVRADSPASVLADLRGARCAINELTSNSGMNVLRAAVAPLAQGRAFFGAALITGGHLASIGAVVSGEADVAAIDCITWAHWRRLQTAEAGLVRVLTWTECTPGLPYITAPATDVQTRAALSRALEDVAQDPSLSEVRATLLLDGFSYLPDSRYRVILDLERAAALQGYPVLC